MQDDPSELRTLVAEVAAAYFSNAHVKSEDIPVVISQIAQSLAGVGAQTAPPEAAQEQPQLSRTRMTPAQVRKSVTESGLVSFEDGQLYKTLRRHLASRGLTPEQYREKHGLPVNYPMVAPSYSEHRSSLAKSLGFGRKAPARAAPEPKPQPAPESAPHAQPAAVPEPSEPEAPPKAKRGRKSKAIAE